MEKQYRYWLEKVEFHRVIGIIRLVRDTSTHSSQEPRELPMKQVWLFNISHNLYLENK